MDNFKILLVAASVICGMNQMCGVKYTKNEYEWIAKLYQDTQQYPVTIAKIQSL